MKEPVRLELGAGARKLPGWISIDAAGTPDIRCDLNTSDLPFADASVDEIYSSHFLEHFYHRDLVGHVLPECLRVLRPGGLFGAAVPDAAIYIRAYVEGRPFPEVIPTCRKAYFFDSPLDSINYIAYMGGDHRHLFDRANLVALLKGAGFCDVRLRDFDAGLDVAKRRAQSIYCVARKAPAAPQS